MQGEGALEPRPFWADFMRLVARARELLPESKLIVKCLKPLPRDFSAVDTTNLFQTLSGGICLGMQDKAAAISNRRSP